MPAGETNVGGQAVIEGVMMRSERYISVAVRKPDGKIALKRSENIPWTKRSKILKTPLIRGGIILIESLIHGIKALSWSADVAMETERDPAEKDDSNSWKAKLGTFLTMVFGLAIGLLLFFWIPLVLTDWIGVESGFAFNAVDGLIRLIIFGLYVGLISLWKEIRRVFEYHGAEHKSIFALENDCPLTVDGARDDRLIRFLFIPVIGGISYEFIRLSSKFRNNCIARFFTLPGLWTQKITTKEPDDEQLEVGLIALRSALGETLHEDNIVHYDNNGVVVMTENSESS